MSRLSVVSASRTPCSRAKMTDSIARSAPAQERQRRREHDDEDHSRGHGRDRGPVSTPTRETTYSAATVTGARPSAISA